MCLFIYLTTAILSALTNKLLGFNNIAIRRILLKNIILETKHILSIKCHKIQKLTFLNTPCMSLLLPTCIALLSYIYEASYLPAFTSKCVCELKKENITNS